MQTYKGTDGFLDFARVVGLTPEQTVIRSNLLRASYMPFLVTDYYAQLIRTAHESDREQLLNIVLPSVGNKEYAGRFDPYGNVRYRRDSNYFIQHKYAPTLLVHMYDFCISNCQFCYKVNEIRHEKKDSVSFENKIATALGYLDTHPEINNILFSGGDPAAMEVHQLIECIGRLLEHPNIRLVRFATKVLAYNPSYFLNDELLQFLTVSNSKVGKQVTVIAQINHPAEISEQSSKALTALRKAGCEIRGQPTLARGINDDKDTLVRLHRRFIDNHIIPYYFTVFMPVRGVEQYGMLLHEAFSLMANAQRELNGLEKKGMLLASHDFGKFEICGFVSTPGLPKEIILRWHERPFDSFLPKDLVERYPNSENSPLVLEYGSSGIYCIDHLFAYNQLPHFDSQSILREN